MSAPDPFRIRDHVAGFDAHVEGYRKASAATRETLTARLDLAYGGGEGERLDLFFPATPGPWPVHLFVHGGYWRAFSRKDYSFVADTVTAAGAIAAVVDYALMPAARMGLLVAQVRRAAFWLAANATSFGGIPGGGLTASGHSAGAHLCCYLRARSRREEAPVLLPPVDRLLLLSGIYDLRPITGSFLQAEIALSEEEVARWSPVEASWPGGGGAAIVAVGEGETEPFHRQANALAGGRHLVLPGEDHMSIVRSLGTPGTRAAGLLASVIHNRRPDRGISPK